MLQFLFFLGKAALIVMTTVWILSHSGAIKIIWYSHEIDFTLGEGAGILSIFSILLIVITYLSFYLTKGRAYTSRIKKLEKVQEAYEILTHAFSVFLIKETGLGQDLVQRARKILGDIPWVLYLEAQGAWLQGEKQMATSFYKKILLKDEHKLLGIIPLIENSLISEEEGIEILKKETVKNPKALWAWENLFNIWIGQKKRAEAFDALKYIKKLAFSSEKSLNSEKKFLLLERESYLEKGDEEKAHEILGKIYTLSGEDELISVLYATDIAARGQKQKALEILSKSWGKEGSLKLAEAFKQIAMEMPKEEYEKWRKHLLSFKVEESIEKVLDF